MTDTIFALSSGQAPAAIAIVRISGPNADAALGALIKGQLPKARHMMLRALSDATVVLDTALVVRFPGPNTATGDNLVELHLHGGRATIAAVCDALSRQPGLRPAEPGEFTRRAFDNGRIDLSAAEGLSDLLRAETEGQRRAALALSSGGLATVVDQLRAEILDVSARVEAALDFDDEDDVQPWPERSAILSALAARVEMHLDAPPAERLHNGIRIALAGPPNAGKSSLFNTLVSRDAAIVSPIAGTTRDVIEVPVRLRGLPFIFIDTAGLRDTTADSVEAIGIARAQAVVATADLTIWLGDRNAVPDGPNVIPVIAKADLITHDATDHRQRVSSLTGEGVAALVDRLADATQSLLPKEDVLALNQRQRSCLSALASECHAAAFVNDLLLAAEHLRLARVAIDRLNGRSGVEDMLDALFGTFCIGK